jgi:hypothetical protein
MPRFSSRSPEDRFWSKVTGDAFTSCWTWTGAQNSNGYGNFTPASRVYVMAHRFAYEALITEIPSGLQIDHLCLNRLCVNPWHMEPVTPRVNVLRSNNRAGLNARRTECINGHPFDAANTGHARRGGRVCRACSREAQRRYATKRRAEMATTVEGGEFR